MAGDLQAQYCVKMTGVFEGKMGTKRWKKYSAVQLSILENTFTFHCQKGKRLKNRTGSAVRETGVDIVSTSRDLGTFRLIFMLIIGGAGDQSLLCSLFTVELT